MDAPCHPRRRALVHAATSPGLPFPVLTVFSGYMAWKRLHGAHEYPHALFACTIDIFLLCFRLSISNFPYLVLPSVTIWDAAAAPSSHIFVLIGVAFLLLMILFYTAFQPGGILPRQGQGR